MNSIDTTAGESETLIQENKTPDHLGKKSAIRELITQNELVKAGQLCDALLSETQEDGEPYFLKALVLFRSNKIKDAEEMVLIAIDKSPYSAEFLTLLAAIYARRRRHEESAAVSDNAVQLDGQNMQALQLRALALIRLFRLKEGHTVLQKIMGLRQEGYVAEAGYSFVTEDLEQLYELALTIDPFKTKTRLEAINLIKEKRYRGIVRFWTAKRNESLLGLAVIGGLIMAIVYFFSDQATYRYFSLLIFIVPWIMISAGNISVMTNFPQLFQKPFKSFLQRSDIILARNSAFCFVLFLGGFVAWHNSQSVVGLVMSIVAAIVFGSISKTFSQGNIRRYNIPQPRAGKSRGKTQPTLLTDAPYERLYPLARNPTKWMNNIAPVLNYSKYILWVMLGWPAAFFVSRAMGLVLDYEILVLPLVAIIYSVLLLVCLHKLFDLPVFFPADAKKFIPVSRKRGAYVMLLLHVLILSSLAAWIVLENGHVLWGSATLFILSVMNIKSRGTIRTEEENKRKELIEYITHRHTLRAQP